MYICMYVLLTGQEQLREWMESRKVGKGKKTTEINEISISQD